MQDQLKIPTDTPADYVPTRPTGLTGAEVAARQEAGLANRVKADPGKSVWQILASNLFSLFNLLNFALALCLVLVGSYRNMLFLGVVFSNTLIGTVQELRAKRTIEKLKLLSAPQASVLRDGREQTCPAEELVQGDLVILRAGDQVLADAIVADGVGAANESLLTGESDAVSKSAGEWLMSGSYITEGRFTAQLVHVGNHSYAARLTKAAKAIKHPKSALMTELGKLVRLVSVVLVPLGMLLFCKQDLINHDPLAAAVPSTVAAMIGMIPEGLLLLTSIALAVGVVKLGRHNTLVQELYGIETLARADVLCLDKTGTITRGDMQLEALIPLDGDEKALRRALSRFLGAFEATSGTLKAIGQAVPPAADTSCAVLPFSSRRKKSAASFPDGTTLILGAPSFVLGQGYSPELRARVDNEASRGMRVLVLAQAQGVLHGEETPAGARPLGLILLSDVLRDNAAQTLRYFRSQGVTVKIISGDDPRTVSAIARRVELEGWQDWVDATTLLDDADLEEAAERYTVFGRVTPQQKCQLVEALKRRGHSVAMTGDGVNDIPALKAADCSIAMAGGADAAKRAAQLTLLDADFAAMPMVVGEGRRVINNITRAASLFLVKTLYSFGLSILTLLLPAAYPFQPIQLTLISSLAIGIPTFFLALEPNEERISGRFLENVLLRAVPGAAAVMVCAPAAMLMELIGYDMAICRTLATLSAGMVELIVLARICLPLTPMRLGLLSIMSVSFAATVAFAGKIFFLDVASMALESWLLLGALIAAAVLVMLLMARRMRRQAQAREGAAMQ